MITKSLKIKILLSKLYQTWKKIILLKNVARVSWNVS